jgi:hypothetical protein
MANLFNLPEDLPKKYHYSLTYEQRLGLWTYEYRVNCMDGAVRAYGGVRYDNTLWCTVGISHSDSRGWTHMGGTNFDEYARLAAELKHDVIFHKLARIADRKWPIK